MPGQIMVGDQHGRRGLARLPDEVGVAHDPHQLEARAAPRLDVAEHVALLPQLEVDLRELEAVQGGGHRIHPLPGEACPPRPR